MEGEKKKTHCLEEAKPFYTCSDQEWRRLQVKWQKRDARIAFMYLGNLANELQFNRNLSTDADPRVRKMAQQCFRETEDLLSILRARRPLYHIQHKYKSCEKVITKQKATLLEKRLGLQKEHAERMLQNILKFGYELRIQDCVDQAHRLKLLLETFPESAAELKLIYLNALCKLMGEIYFKIKALHPKLSKEDNYARVGLTMGQNQVFNDMYFNWISDMSPFPFFDCKLWIKTYRDFIDTSRNDLERAWLHHELSRAYIVIKKWPRAAAEARKCVNYAKQCGDNIWEANGMFLIVIGESRRKEGETLAVFQQCYNVALKIRNETFLEFLAVVKEVLNDRAKEKPYDALAANAKREEEIIRLMDGLEAKGRARDLFARMRAVRCDRRMSLIQPGLVPSDNKRGGTLSIIPGGSGGRLGLHAFKDQPYHAFLGLPAAYN